MARIALYLAGGGARGAYQAGILKAVSHILSVKSLPFSMVSGVSVGSINAAILAQHADNFPLGIEQLESLWLNIHCEQIFKARNSELSRSLLRNLSHLFIKSSQPTHFLDTDPLHTFISDHINFDRIKINIENNKLDTMEVISHCYETQRTVSFYQHNKPHFEDWNYPRHVSQRVGMSMEHILASSALPLFFPTVKIAGAHYGDGGMGLISPLRGALRFQVEKILILGTRHCHSLDMSEKLSSKDIGFAHVLGSILNSVFLDNLERDIELVNRMNEIVQLLSLWKKRNAPWRPVETMYIRPSVDVGKIARANYQVMPTLLRGLLNLLGAQSQSGDLLSFLLFEREFTEDLLELGYNDTIKNAPAVIRFFEAET